MASLRDVKSKITGVKKTKQITKAMNMVASAKMRNAQARIERFRPYAAKFYEMLKDLASGADASVHPLLEVREEVKTVGVVLVTSDRGLCGSFNTNLIKMATKLAAAKKAEGKAIKFYCVGKKGRDTARKLEYEIGMELIAGYLAGDLDEVQLIYGEFVSMAKQPAVTLQVLPIAQQGEAEEAPAGTKAEYVYEPSVEGLLAELLPRFIKVQIYRGLLDTSASEHAARMAAMDNATRNCNEMINMLTRLYNKTRQASITSDLIDIVGGAEALKG